MNTATLAVHAAACQNQAHPENCWVLEKGIEYAMCTACFIKAAGDEQD